MDIYCMWCGERLDTEDGHARCVSCGTDYSSLIISESEVEVEDEKILELSVCMDCTQIKRPVKPISFGLDVLSDMETAIV